MATYYVDDGGGKAVTAATNANPCQVTITGHGFSTNDKVVFHNIGGMTQLNFTNGSTGYTVTVVDTDNITIGVNSTAYGAYTSGGTAHNGKSWGAAYTSVSQLDDIYSLNGDTIYIGHDHVCQYAHTINRSLTLTNCTIISATTGSNPPTYQASTTNQIDTSEGPYQLTLNFKAAYGVRFKSGHWVKLADLSGSYCQDCTFVPSSGSFLHSGDYGLGRFILKNITIDLSADSAGQTGHVLYCRDYTEIDGLSFISPGNRTGAIFYGYWLGYTQTGSINVVNADFSGFASTCEIVDANNAYEINISNCKTPATWTPIIGNSNAGHKITLINTGSASQPTYLTNVTATGTVVSATDIYRSSGATVEGTSNSWLVTTTANCSQDIAYYSPWIYGYIGSTGSKTFDLYITNDTADFNDNEVWLEIDYLGTASSGRWSNKTDYMADRLATAAVQTDDTSSTWNGSGVSFTYKQKLSVTATVNTAGMFRARVCVGVASIASTRKFYIDPLVTVS